MEEKAEEIIQELSKSLKDDLLTIVHGKIFKEIRLFEKYFSKELLVNLADKVKKICLIPGDIIFEENDIENISVYLIQKGEVK